ITEADDPVEFVLDIAPSFAGDGEGQVFGFRVDGTDAAIFVINDGGTIGILFGETGSIYTPDPANLVALSNGAAALTALRLIINYDPVEMEYNAFYGENGGAVVAHPSSPLAKSRTDGVV